MAGWVHLKDYTMMRGLMMDFNGDSKVMEVKDQWMFGPALMACPVGYYKARSRKVYFPKQCGWYDLYTGEHIDGGQTLVVDAPYDKIPVFVREGSIIPYGPEIQYTDEKPADLITLYVYAGSDGEFQLYEDEGTNYNYEKGKYTTIDITYNDTMKTLSLGQRQGAFKGMLKERRFLIVYVTKEQPRELDFVPQKALLLEYKGKPISVNL
jgi:alpha-D-xyloside xylohydrolase